MRLRTGFAWWLTGLLAAPSTVAADRQVVLSELAARGEYVFHAAGCYGCHTDEKHGGKGLAGGRALATPFGTFYSPNITPDPDNGIGRWSEADFIRALREGISPKGEQYYPAFPYPSFTLLTDNDLRALWFYLHIQPAVAQKNRAHDLKWYARARSFVASWKALYFVEGPYRPEDSRSVSWNRGAYLAEAAAHCGECHTPRTALGGIKRAMHFAGTREGPEHSVIPNITPDKKTGIGRWNARELAQYLENGMTPDGDSAGDLMAETIDNGLKYLTSEDRAAIAEYVLSLPPVENAVKKPKKKEKGEFE